MYQFFLISGLIIGSHIGLVKARLANYLIYTMNKRRYFEFPDPGVFLFVYCIFFASLKSVLSFKWCSAILYF